MFLIFWLLLCIIPCAIANNQGRSGFGWFILGALISPFLSIIILLCIGETEEKRKEKIAKEEFWRMEIQRKVSQGRESKNDSSVNLGKTVNDLYNEHRNLR